MYLLSVILLMAALPAGSVWVEHFHFHSPVALPLLVGKWFVFWSVGIRLTLAGLRQQIQPRFTSEHIFGIKGDDPLPFVRELGVANLATGVVGVLALPQPTFVLPVAIAGTIFYGIAGVHHVLGKRSSANETIAMISDLLAALVLGFYVAFVYLG
jgi:hypothetical protein